MYHVLSGCHDVTEALKLQADLMALLVLGFHLGNVVPTMLGF